MTDINKEFNLFARSECNVPTTVLEAYQKLMASGYISPSIIEERKLNIASMDVFSRLMMDRSIFLGTGIDSDVANIVTAQLLFLGNTGQDDITLYINSLGGSVYDGMAIYDTMKVINPDVSTICIGTAASMGAVLLGGGANGKRRSLKHSQIMIHQPSGGTGRVQATDMKIAAKEMEKCENMLYTCMAEDTGKSFEEIAAACDRDHWLTPTEAVDFGIIDSIISKR